MNDWFRVKKLNKNVWGIGEFNNDEKVISYLVVGSSKALLIDTGMGVEDIKKEVRNIVGKLPIVVINTHCHFDHVGGNKLFNNLLLFDNSLSIKIAKEGISNKIIQMYSSLDGLKGKIDIKKYHVDPFIYSQLCNENLIINLEPFTFKIIHTPGHSPDSICIYEINYGWLFSGDTLYNGPIYLHLKESNISDYHKSIDKLSNISRITKIFPGHNSFSFNVNYIDLIKQSLKNKVNQKSTAINVKSKLKLLIKS